ncbi:MAG TPA: DUF167 domain-containing protein [bacterium]
MGAGTGRDALIAVRVTSRAVRDVIGPWRSDRLEVRTTAAPVDDQANHALCRLLAATLDVAPSRVHVVRGARGREKTVQVLGLPAAEVFRRLGRPDSSAR